MMKNFKKKETILIVQGPAALWKGVLTSVAYHGLVTATDNFLQDLIPVKK